MNCKKMEPLLALYVEGDLGETEAEKVRSHLRNCPACGRLLKEYQRSETTFKNLHRSALAMINPPKLSPKVLAKISPVRPRRLVTLWRYWLAAGIAAAVILGLIYFIRGFETQNIMPRADTLVATHPAPSNNEQKEITVCSSVATPVATENNRPDAPEPKTIRMVFYTPKYRIIWLFKEPPKITLN